MYVNLVSDQLGAGLVGLSSDGCLYFSLSQEDVETSLENLQDIDMMDISVLDEAEIDNGSVGDWGTMMMLKTSRSPCLTVESLWRGR